MADDTCRDFKPDHNGECLNCDGWFSAHPPDTRLAAADRTIPLLLEQARKWNTEADRYLAQRDALQVRVAELEDEIERLKASLTS